MYLKEKMSGQNLVTYPAVKSRSKYLYFRETPAPFYPKSYAGWQWHFEVCVITNILWSSEELCIYILHVCICNVYAVCYMCYAVVLLSCTGCFFYWSAQCQTLRKFWQLELFWRDLHVIWHLSHFLGRTSKKNHPVHVCICNVYAVCYMCYAGVLLSCIPSI